ncbi:3'-5' exonuclease-like [Salvia miltiorrhiza]|uniref:3'-5' exonuclease-like n=1 Tax=Salvia miltiorrhiza TaxID=226208 RepID=UPI0025ABD11C|nr:3'-5' exonuclease-like [Salvia miltiorrhiza]
MAISIQDHRVPSSEGYNTYDVYFYDDSISTTVTTSPDKVSEWINEVEWIHRRRLHRLIVGLDVEWRPSSERRRRNPVATLQLCVGRRCLVYQIYHSRYIPQTLADFLSEENYTFVGVGIQSDLGKLYNDYEIGGDAGYVDLRELAANEYGMNSLKNAGLKRLAVVVLETEFDKPRQVTMSRWDNRWLTAEQVQYATVDAFVSFEIGRALNACDYGLD